MGSPTVESAIELVRHMTTALFFQRKGGRLSAIAMSDYARGELPPFCCNKLREHNRDNLIVVPARIGFVNIGGNGRTSEHWQSQAPPGAHCHPFLPALLRLADCARIQADMHRRYIAGASTPERIDGSAMETRRLAR